MAHQSMTRMATTRVLYHKPRPVWTMHSLIPDVIHKMHWLPDGWQWVDVAFLGGHRTLAICVVIESSSAQCFMTAATPAVTVRHVAAIHARAGVALHCYLFLGPLKDVTSLLALVWFTRSKFGTNIYTIFWGDSQHFALASKRRYLHKHSPSGVDGLVLWPRLDSGR